MSYINQAEHELPIVGEHFRKQAGKNAEVTDAENVNVDHVTQTMNNWHKKKQIKKIIINKI